MSLPKNDQNLSKEEYDKLWGPETSVDGFWDRDDIYDNLQSSGWNKEGDEKIIAAFWKIGARDDFYTLIPASLYENRVTTDKERADLIREVLEYAETKDLDLTGLEEEVKSLQEERKTLEERIAQEARRQEAERKAQEEAQREQRVREEAERQRRAEERRIQREKEAQELREKMEREKQAESAREQRRLEEAENQRLWDKWAEGHDNIYYGREWWEQKKAEMLEDERQQREGIGKYSKEAMEKAQREHDEEVRKEEEERQRQKEIEEERAKAEEARRQAELEAELAQREEQRKKDLEAEGRRTVKSREYMKRFIELGLDEYNTENGVEPTWGTKIKDEDHHTMEELMELLDREREADPDKFHARDNLIQADKDIKAMQYLLRNPMNREFVQAVKNGGDWQNAEFHFLGMKNIDRLNTMDEATYKEKMDILNKIGEKNVKNPADLLNEENLKDEFWMSNGQGRITREDVQEMRDVIDRMTKAGMIWEEYQDSGAYSNYLRENGIDPAEVCTPITVGELAFAGQEGEEELLREFNQREFLQVMTGLIGIEKEFAEKGREHIADVDAWGLSSWLDRNGYDLIDNFFLVKNGVESKVVDGEVVKVFNMDGDLEIPEVDRDIWSKEEYQALISKAQETKTLYQENKDAFQNAFDVMYRSRHGMGYMLEYVREEMDRINRNKELVEKLNQFRHNLYEVKLRDENVCKLLDKDKQPVLVESLKEDAAFDAAMREKEIKILETCYDMLKEPSMRVKRNSSEYNSIMKSIADVKKVLREEPDNEKAKAAYVKTVNKVLNNINRYRVHKAKDGVNEQDATYDKIIAMERVDKLLRTRYQSLEQREYEDTIGAVADLFKVEVKDPDKTGDEYVFEKAMGKIGNMRKQIEDYRAEIEQERALEKRGNSIGGIVHDDVVQGILEGTFKAKEEADRQAAPRKKEGSLKEKFGFDEAPEQKEGRKLAEDLKAQGTGKKLADKLLSDRDKELIETNLSNNEMLIAVNEKELKYRNGLDIKDETEKSRYMNSVAKSLYVECLCQASIKKGLVSGEKMGKEALEKGLTALNKSSIKARAFMAEHLTDKDFNREFRDRVLEGAAQGKTGHADIVKFRDEALTACYQNYKGKDTKKLDELSAILGSKVNSRKLTKQVETQKKQIQQRGI